MMDIVHTTVLAELFFQIQLAIDFCPVVILTVNFEHIKLESSNIVLTSKFSKTHLTTHNIDLVRSQN